MTEEDALYLSFLKSVQAQEYFATTLLIESALQKDWLLSEEEEVWRDLQRAMWWWIFFRFQTCLNKAEAL
jgi:hypothetical protein